jgi:hypothetical protein
MRVIRLFVAVLALTLTAACGDFSPTGPQETASPSANWCIPQGGFIGGGC